MNSNNQTIVNYIHHLQTQNNKIGFVCSCFDLLHAGHQLMLKDAKSKCDFLVVALQKDPTVDADYRIKTDGKNKNKPVQCWEERYIQITSSRYVDCVLEYTTEKDLYILLKALKPNIRILGSDWEGKEFTGHDIEGITNYFHQRDHDFSTSNLRKRVYQMEKVKLENTQ